MTFRYIYIWYIQSFEKMMGNVIGLRELHYETKIQFMKKIFLKFNVIIGMMVALTFAACDNNGDDVFVTINDTIIVNVYGDTSYINIKVEGDSIVNHLHGGDTEVNGGDVNNNTTITNNGNGNNGGDVNSNSNITYGTTVTTLKNGVLIRIKDPRALSTNVQEDFKRGMISTSQQLRMLRGNFDRRDIRDIERENPGKIVISAGYYDANNDPTTLSFPAQFLVEADKVLVNGKFGADDDRQENLSALVWSDNFGKVLSVGNYNRLFLPKESNYIVGFGGKFGKSAESKTGRTLVSYTHEGELLILVVTNTTQLEAFKFIQEEGGIQVATLNGGGSVQYVNGNDNTTDDIVNHSKQVPLFLVIAW